MQARITCARLSYLSIWLWGKCVFSSGRPFVLLLFFHKHKNKSVEFKLGALDWNVGIEYPKYATKKHIHLVGSLKKDARLGWTNK